MFKTWLELYNLCIFMYENTKIDDNKREVLA